MIYHGKARGLWFPLCVFLVSCSVPLAPITFTLTLTLAYSLPFSH